MPTRGVSASGPVARTSARPGERCRWPTVPEPAHRARTIGPRRECRRTPPPTAPRRPAPPRGAATLICSERSLRLKDTLALTFGDHVARHDVTHDPRDERVAAWLRHEPAAPFEL